MPLCGGSGILTNLLAGVEGCKDLAKSVKRWALFCRMLAVSLSSGR